MMALALLLAEPVWVGQFAGSGAPPPPWRVVRLSRKVPPTLYRVASIDGKGAVESLADHSMALLARPIAVDLRSTPILCWRWRVDAPVAGADMRKKRGDDYAARLYVAFDMPNSRLSAGTRLKLRLARSLFGRDVPDAALNYVWDNRNPVGTRLLSAYTDRAQLIVAETGAGSAGTWVSERADVARDFTAAFGGSARPIQLAVATDTDDTGSLARAAFADIHFVSRSEPCRL